MPADRRIRALTRDGRREWFALRVPEDGSPAEAMIYDEIGFWGVTAQDFVREIESLGTRALNVRINSPGGDVFDGIAILNALRAHEGRVTTIVDGLAASAASFIAMGGDELVMRRNSELMIHDAWAMTIGNAEEMRRAADDLDRHSNSIASIYAERAGGTVDEWREIMRAEQWFTADEAVEAGLADRVDRPDDAPADADAEKLRARFDLSVFNYAGRRAAPAPAALNLRRTRAAHDLPGAARDTHTDAATAAPVDRKDGTTMPDFNEEIRARFGLPADATDEAVLERLDAELAEETAEETAAAPAVPDGAVVIDAGELEELRTAARAGQTALARQEADDRARVLDAAIAAGKFPPARREHYAAMLQADPEGATALINALAPGLVPLSEVGHGKSGAETTDDDAVYASLFRNESKEG